MFYLELQTLRSLLCFKSKVHSYVTNTLGFRNQTTTQLSRVSLSKDESRVAEPLSCVVTELVTTVPRRPKAPPTPKPLGRAAYPETRCQYGPKLPSGLEGKERNSKLGLLDGVAIPTGKTKLIAWGASPRVRAKTRKVQPHAAPTAKRSNCTELRTHARATKDPGSAGQAPVNRSLSLYSSTSHSDSFTSEILRSLLIKPYLAFSYLVYKTRSLPTFPKLGVGCNCKGAGIRTKVLKGKESAEPDAVGPKSEFEIRQRHELGKPEPETVKGEPKSKYDADERRNTKGVQVSREQNRDSDKCLRVGTFPQSGELKGKLPEKQTSDSLVRIGPRTTARYYSPSDPIVQRGLCLYSHSDLRVQMGLEASYRTEPEVHVKRRLETDKLDSDHEIRIDVPVQRGSVTRPRTTLPRGTPIRIKGSESDCFSRNRRGPSYTWVYVSLRVSTKDSDKCLRVGTFPQSGELKGKLPEQQTSDSLVRVGPRTTARYYSPLDPIVQRGVRLYSHSDLGVQKALEASYRTELGIHVKRRPETDEADSDHKIRAEVPVQRGSATRPRTTGPEATPVRVKRSEFKSFRKKGIGPDYTWVYTSLRVSRERNTDSDKCLRVGTSPPRQSTWERNSDPGIRAKTSTRRRRQEREVPENKPPDTLVRVGCRTTAYNYSPSDPTVQRGVCLYSHSGLRVQKALEASYHSELEVHVERRPRTNKSDSDQEIRMGVPRQRGSTTRPRTTEPRGLPIRIKGSEADKLDSDHEIRIDVRGQRGSGIRPRTTEPARTPVRVKGSESNSFRKKRTGPSYTWVYTSEWPYSAHVEPGTEETLQVQRQASQGSRREVENRNRKATAPVGL